MTPDVEPVEVRAPGAAEARAGGMLLPESGRWPWPAEYLLALGGSPHQILGAIARAPTPRPDGPAWQLAARVIRTHRRRGIGTRMLGALIDRARGAGIRFLVAAVGAESGPEAIPFLRSAGFAADREMLTFEGDFDRYTALLYPLRRRLEDQGKIPAGVRLVPLASAPLDQVGRLYARHLGGTVDGVEHSLRRVLAQGGVDGSFALMLGDRVVGIHVLGHSGEVLSVYAKVVAPEFRRGWANVVMMEQTLRQFQPLGIRRVRFSAADDVADTRKLAARGGADLVASEARFVLDLGPTIPKET